MAAKTKVAPSVVTSIPRLESMAAVIGVRITSKISTVLKIPISRAMFWSDSLNVLWWIRGRSRQFKPFVGNKVGEIQSSTDPEQWRYVPIDINPADLLSRELRAIDLEICERWWRDPAFLQRSEEAWPLNKLIDKPTGNEELKRSTALQNRFTSQATEYSACANHDGIVGAVFVSTSGTEEAFPLDPSRYSNWLRLKRILAWIFRFIHNCQRTKRERTRG